MAKDARSGVAAARALGTPERGAPSAFSNRAPPRRATPDPVRHDELDEGARRAIEVVLHELVENLVRDSRSLEARFIELQGVTELLRNDVETSTRRLRLIIAELEVVELRLQRGSSAPVALERRGHAPRLDARREPIGARRTLRPARLGAREREVLKLLTDGLRSPCIAQRLGIATATVEVHRRNIMRKLNLHSIAALTKYALRNGLTSL